MIEISQIETAEQIEEARKLFREYKKWLGLDLCFQGFEEELNNLPAKYAMPDGRLFLALLNGKTAGYIALRKLEQSICEMKRLYIRGEFRRLGLGRVLIEKLIEEVRVHGYEKMCLDTLPNKMSQAVKLYKSYGFAEISPYYENPHKETLFLELNLKK